MGTPLSQQRERVRQRRQIAELTAGRRPSASAAWAKEKLAGAKQTLPNGYC